MPLCTQCGRTLDKSHFYVDVKDTGVCLECRKDRQLRAAVLKEQWSDIEERLQSIAIAYRDIPTFRERLNACLQQPRKPELRNLRGQQYIYRHIETGNYYTLSEIAEMVGRKPAAIHASFLYNRQRYNKLYIKTSIGIISKERINDMYKMQRRQTTHCVQSK